MDFSGKHILVTGASAGIGKATAEYVSQLGAKVTLVARDQAKLNSVMNMLNGCEHKAYSFDLTQVDSIIELVDSVTAEQGPVAGIVHCAGSALFRPLNISTYSFMHESMLVNFYAFVELVRCFSKKNKVTENASFVTISSVASIVGEKSRTAYCASKAAVDSAIRCMAKELAPKKIRVNSIVAGFVATELYTEYLEQYSYSEDAQRSLERHYIGVVEPVEIAFAITYLLSDLSKTTTGTGMVVDGGYLS